MKIFKFLLSFLCVSAFYSNAQQEGILNNTQFAADQIANAAGDAVVAKAQEAGDALAQISSAVKQVEDVVEAQAQEASDVVSQPLENLKQEISAASDVVDARVQEAQEALKQVSDNIEKQAVMDVVATTAEQASGKLGQVSEGLEHVYDTLHNAAQEESQESELHSYLVWIIPIAFVLLVLWLVRFLFHRPKKRPKHDHKPGPHRKHKHGDLHRGHKLSEHERSGIKKERSQDLHHEEHEEKKQR